MKITFLVLLFFSSLAIAHEPAHVENRVGSGRAVEAFDDEDGFKLSAKAQKKLGIVYSKIQGPGPWDVPKAAIVQIKQSFAVYRLYNDWNSMVLVKIIETSQNQVKIISEDLEPDDQIAVSGASFLRMTESDLNAGTVDSCSH